MHHRANSLHSHVRDLRRERARLLSEIENLEPGSADHDARAAQVEMIEHRLQFS
jgi:hypothetical protein